MKGGLQFFHQMTKDEEMFSMKDLTLVMACVVHLMVDSSHSSEIIGGKEVTPHSLRYMAWLKPACGGTLIHPEWVLTAAHCTKIKEVVLGAHSIKKEEKQSRQVRRVAKMFPHPHFNKKNKDNDLMLLKLHQPVKQTNTVQCLSLQKTIKDPAAGTRCLVAGWGATNDNGKHSKMSDVLRSVFVTVVSREQCNSQYRHKPTITQNMVCAGSKGKKKTDTCRGDSGGPLLCNGMLVGVTSFGGKCGDPVLPGVYSFLTQKQLKWIEETMKKPAI